VICATYIINISWTPRGDSTPLYSVATESKTPLSSTKLTVSGFLTCAELYNTKSSDHSMRFIGQ
jgi:hypothetical protein